jgi:hypothetical protein
MIFPAAAAALSKRTGQSEAAGTALGLDFAGAFAGSMAASVFLIPIAGVVTACAAAAALNLLIWARLKIEKN